MEHSLEQCFSNCGCDSLVGYEINLGVHGQYRGGGEREVSDMTKWQGIVQRKPFQLRPADARVLGHDVKRILRPLTFEKSESPTRPSYLPRPGDQLSGFSG